MISLLFLSILRAGLSLYFSAVSINWIGTVRGASDPGPLGLSLIGSSVLISLVQCKFLPSFASTIYWYPLELITKTLSSSPFILIINISFKFINEDKKIESGEPSSPPPSKLEE